MSKFVKNGFWIYFTDYELCGGEITCWGQWAYTPSLMQCSECGSQYDVQELKNCPHCKARMRRRIHTNNSEFSYIGDFN